MPPKPPHKPLNPNNPIVKCTKCGAEHQTKHKWCGACQYHYKMVELPAKKAAAAADQEAKARAQADATFELELLVPDPRARKMVPYLPNERQRAFHESSHPIRAVVGGRGSGKSIAGLVELIVTAIAYPGTNLLVAQLRRSDLEGGTWQLLWKILPRKLIASSRKDPLEITLKNGSVIHGRHLSEPESLGSTFYAAIFVDECSHFEDETVIYSELLGRLRSAEGPNRIWFAGYTNGKNWVWRRFFDKPNEDHFGVAVSIYDNETHVPPSFLRLLERNYSEKERAQYLRGEFVDDLGEIFFTFETPPGTHVVAPFEPPSHWRRFVGLDPGIMDYCAVVWVAIDEGGCHWVYRTFRAKNLIISQICEEVAAQSATERIEYLVLDPYVAHERNDETGIQKIELYRKYLPGWYIRAGQKCKEADVGLIRELLRPDEDGNPRLKIFSSEGALIGEVRNWRRDKNGKPQDRNDDLLSAMRYVLSSRPYAADSQVKAPQMNPLWARMHDIIAELAEDEVRPHTPIGSKGIAWGG